MTRTSCASLRRAIRRLPPGSRRSRSESCSRGSCDPAKEPALRRSDQRTEPRGRRALGMSESDDQLFGPQHVHVYQETNGERGYQWRGTEILLLTTKGRKSGKSRTMPLIHRADGDRWVVIGSKGGWPANPQWFENLMAGPDEATIQVKGDVIPVRASVAEGEERQRR